MKVMNNYDNNLTLKFQLCNVNSLISTINDVNE